MATVNRWFEDVTTCWKAWRRAKTRYDRYRHRPLLTAAMLEKARAARQAVAEAEFLYLTAWQALRIQWEEEHQDIR